MQVENEYASHKEYVDDFFEILFIGSSRKPLNNGNVVEVAHAAEDVEDKATVVGINVTRNSWRQALQYVRNGKY